MLGIKIGKESRREIFDFVDRKLKEGKGDQIVTLNPEFLLMAERHDNFRRLLNRASLRVVDGFGIKLMAWLKGEKTGERITGADLAGYILDRACQQSLKVGLIMRRGGWSSREQLEKFAKEKSDVKIYEISIDAQNDSVVHFGEVELLDRQVLLVGLGAPHQEVFIDRFKDRLFDLRLAIGVGGTFDYWTGKKKRAPKWLRSIGLEWVWRLTIQPNRFVRIWKATVIFPIKVLKKK